MKGLSSNRILARLASVALALGIVAVLAIAAQAWSPDGPPTVTPAIISGTLKPGESITQTLTVYTGSAPVPKADIVFSFDRTSSMEDEINAAKSNALDIMNRVRATIADTQFGVVSHMDYPGTYTYPGYSEEYGRASRGDVPFERNQDITADTSRVAAAINRLTMGWGADGPEDYTRVLYETLSMNWRAPTKKILVMIGDAPTHDLTFAGYNYGGDPGRDAVAQTADDLEFVPVVQQLRSEGVTVLSILGTPSNDPAFNTSAEATFKGVSEGYAQSPGTHGSYFRLSNASQVPDTIVQLVQGELTNIHVLRVSAPVPYDQWVRVTPGEYNEVGRDTTKAFQVVITVPAGTAAGEHTFRLNVLADGALLGASEVTIIVPQEAGNDLGFRADPDGFKFENFGAALTWDMFEQYFGRGVVRHANSDKVYAAEQFFNTSYKPVGEGGNCLGFSSSSPINFRKLGQPNAGSFALPYLDKLYTRDKTDEMDQAIRYLQGTQVGDEMYSYMSNLATVAGNSPKYYYGRVKEYIQNGDPVVLGIIKKDDGGHALTPYKIEEPSANEARVYVYDSNHPGDNERYVEFDLAHDKWTYEFRKFLWIIPINWSGDSSYHSMTVIPLSMFLHQGVAKWDPSASLPRATSVLMNNVSVQAMFVDPQGRRLGFDGSAYYDEIPGALRIPPAMGNGDSPFDMYYLPQSAYTMTLQGTATGKADVSFYDRLGHLAQVRGASMTAGSTDQVKLGADVAGFTYTTADSQKEVSLALDTETSGASRAFILNHLNFKAGDNATLNAAADGQSLSFANGDTGKSYDLWVRAPGTGATPFGHLAVPIDGDDTHVISPTWSSLSTVTVGIDRGSDGSVDATETLTNQVTSLNFNLGTQWSLISTGMVMDESRVESVFDPVDYKVGAVMTFDGQPLAYFPDLSSSFNTLTDVDGLHGYWIRSTATVAMPVWGIKLPVNTPIAVRTGWNMVSYLPTRSLPVTDALQSIIGSVTAVRGYKGGAMSYWPQLPAPMNTLQVMEPGLGYLIRATDNMTLTYPAAAVAVAESDAVLATRNAPQSPAGVAATNQWMDVYSLRSTINGQPIPMGATVSVYDVRGRKVGETIVTHSGWIGVLAVYGDDPTTPDIEGARVGEALSFRVNSQTATTLGPDVPVWTGDGQLRQIDLSATEAQNRLWLPFVNSK